MAENDDKTTEVVDQAELVNEALDSSDKKTADTSKETENTDTKEDSAAADETVADGDKETKTDDKSEDDDSKAVDNDSTAEKEQNRIGYQLRQIRGGDAFVAQAKRALTADYVNAPDLTDDQREIRQIKADQYIEKLETSRATLASDNQKVAEEYPFFNPADKENFKKDLYDRALQRFSRDSLEMSDPDNEGKQEIVGYKVRLLDYMREEADAYLAGSNGSKDVKAEDKSDEKKDEKKDDSDKKDDSKTQAEMDAASEDPGGVSDTKANGSDKESPIVKDFLSGFDSVK